MLFLLKNPFNTVTNKLDCFLAGIEMRRLMPLSDMKKVTSKAHLILSKKANEQFSPKCQSTPLMKETDLVVISGSTGFDCTN